MSEEEPFVVQMHDASIAAILAARKLPPTKPLIQLMQATLEIMRDPVTSPYHTAMRFISGALDAFTSAVLEMPPSQLRDFLDAGRKNRHAVIAKEEHLRRRRQELTQEGKTPMEILQALNEDPAMGHADAMLTEAVEARLALYRALFDPEVDPTQLFVTDDSPGIPGNTFAGENN